MVRFQLLGHLAAQSERGPVPLGTARQRAVLAALLVEPGLPVPFDQLVERVWGTAPPRSARQTLHSYISRLRGVLDDAGGPAPARRSGGYALDVDPIAVDLHQFRALAAQARCADDSRADALWQDAMALWRGKPFADLDSDWLRSFAVTLEAERQAAALDHFDLLLRRGEHTRLLPEVAAAVRVHPLDERLAGQLMLALYRCGRQADALAHFRLVQESLADELGSDPGPELRELHQRILRHDAEPTVPDGRPDADRNARTSAPASDVAADKPPRPAQLPLDVTGFTGRSDDLRRLDELLLPGADGRAGRTVVITAIRGTAGVGKTALAVHWAHRAAHDFPDGQLYVNLRGYDPEQPVRPTDALARFLAALGVPERDIPLGDDERAARYRSELADRRMLIVLDNAGSVAQVRPLLPGSGASTVVVTSRDSLAGLVAVHGAQRIDLDLLPATDAADLLRHLIGERVDADPGATQLLAEQCARLPLALRVAAVLATSQPDRPLADVAAELADRQERLELLDAGGDPYAAVHAVFSWSIQHLPEQAARTFRRLGLHPGPDLDQYVAAALTGLEPNAARRVLETLVAAHLLHRTGSGRYGMHDLLRAYATRLAATEDSAGKRAEAEQRLFAYYQTAAIAAVDVLYPNEGDHRRVAGSVGVEIRDLAGPDAARGWLEAEWQCVLAIAEHAAEVGASDFLYGFARTVNGYAGQAHFADVLTINGHALRAAERAGDLAGQAGALRQLAAGYTRLSAFEASIDHARRALEKFRQVGDSDGEALTLTNLGSTENIRGHYKDARSYHCASLAVFRRTEDRHGQALALNNLGVSEARLGHLAESVEVQHQALAIFQELGSRFSEATTLGNIAGVEMRRERLPEAADLLRRSIAIAEEMGSDRSRANSLDTLGSLHLRLGEPDRARECFEQALAHFVLSGERASQAWSTNGLGEVALFAGDAAGAVARHTEALALAGADGARHQEARAHAGIGHAHRALGNSDLARTHYEQACAIYTDLGMPEAEEIRAVLGELSAA
jgi:DNA-binding SARP family transcriptional activator/tetratricopeptide (TPR) repeat protein